MFEEKGPGGKNLGLTCAIAELFGPLRTTKQRLRNRKQYRAATRQ
jgi:hypothetical protein